MVPDPIRALEQQHASYQHQIERWIQELRDAGWIQVHVTTWQAPNGLRYRGPYGAWKKMREAERVCVRCGHPDHWHTHDDHDCLSKHSQPCVPETAPFRCLGYDCNKPGFANGTPESRCGCADFVEAAIREAEAKPSSPHTCHDMNPPHPYPCAACVAERGEAEAEQARLDAAFKELIDHKPEEEDGEAEAKE